MEGDAPDEDVPQFLARTGVLGILATLADIPNSPIAAGLGAIAASALDAGAKKYRSVQHGRAVELYGQAKARTNLDDHALMRRVLSDEGSLELFALCMEAAMTTSLAQKRKIIAILLGDGLMDQDPARLDNRLYMARILHDLERPHLVLLARLGELGENGSLSVVNLSALLDPPHFVDAALGVLVRNGLARQMHTMLSPQYPTTYDNAGQTASDPPGAHFEITIFGREFLAWSREAESDY